MARCQEVAVEDVHLAGAMEDVSIVRVGAAGRNGNHGTVEVGAHGKLPVMVEVGDYNVSKAKGNDEAIPVVVCVAHFPVNVEIACYRRKWNVNVDSVDFEGVCKRKQEERAENDRKPPHVNICARENKNLDKARRHNIHVRGFNLFAAFLGVAMIAIAVGYSMYVHSVQMDKSQTMQEELVRFDTAGVAEAIKSDVYNTILSRLQRDFQYILAHNVIDPPQSVWEGGEGAFKSWFERDYAQSEALTYTVADRMMAELQAYSASQVFGQGYDVSIVGSVDATAGALRGNTRAEILPNGTFAYVIDTEHMSPKAYSKLPKIVVRKMGSTSGVVTSIVLPRGVWTIPINLRIMDGFRVADRVYWYMKNSGAYQRFALAEGHCRQDNLAVCDVFQLRGSEAVPLTRPRGKFRDLSVSSLDSADVKASLVSPCTQQSVNYLTLVKNTGIDKDRFAKAIITLLEQEKEELQRAMNDADESTAKKIADAITNIDNEIAKINAGKYDELKDVPCGDDYESLSPLLNVAGITITENALLRSGVAALRDPQVHDQLVTGIKDLRITPDIADYNRFETAKIVSRTAINPLQIICSEVTSLPGAVLKLLLSILGYNANTDPCTKIGTHGMISFDECKISNSVYCVAPKEYAYIVTWWDHNPHFRVDPSSTPQFNFKITFGKIPYVSRLEALQRVAEQIRIAPESKQERQEQAKKITMDALATASQFLPGMIDSCMKQYATVELRCRSGMSDANITYILTGIPPAYQKGCESGTMGGNMCNAKDDLKSICRRLNEDKYKNVEIPGLFKHRGTLNVTGGDYYCDRYLGIRGALTRIQDVGNKLWSIASRITCPSSFDPKKWSAGDAAKAILFGAQCLGMSASQAKEALGWIGEYNSIYHRAIEAEVEAAEKTGVLGRCSIAKDPELNAFIQAFSEPKMREVGGIEIPEGGTCHPDHVLDQALSMARMRAASIRCNIVPPNAKAQVLQEITWLHIGQEIYASCNPMN